MSKPEAISAISNLLERIQKEKFTDEEIEAIVKLALKEGVIETLLDGLHNWIDKLRPSKYC